MKHFEILKETLICIFSFGKDFLYGLNPNLHFKRKVVSDQTPVH